MNNQQLWQAILGSLEISLSKANFNTWFKNTGILERGDDNILVGVPSAFSRDWIASKYHAEMLKALKTLAPEIKEIKYQLGGNLATAALNQQPKISAKVSSQQQNQQVSSNNNASGLNPNTLLKLL